MSPLTYVEGRGFFYNDQYYPIDSPRPGTPLPYRVRTPFEHPFSPESFWNTPVGEGAAYVPTDDPRHTNLFPDGAQWFATNGQGNGNWTEQIYYSTASDPLSEVRQYANIPAGWTSLGPTDIGTTSTESNGRLYLVYKGLRIPPDARWHATSNTDRKCIVVQDFDCTLTVEKYNASSQLIETTQEFYPRGTLSVEIHKFYRTSGDGGGGPNTLYYSSNLGRADLRSHGGGYGPIASGVSITQGYVRSWELAEARDGDYTAIRHALKLGVPGDRLYGGDGPIWPASHQDGSWASTYSGLNPMGTMIVLDKDADIDALTYTGNALQSNLQKAIAWTLQTFGAYILIFAGSNGSPIKIGFEAKEPFLLNADASELAGSGKFLNTAELKSLYRIVANSNPYPAGTRIAPAHPSPVAGGGKRITAGKALDGFNGATGLQMPFDPDPTSWYVS